MNIIITILFALTNFVESTEVSKCLKNKGAKADIITQSNAEYKDFNFQFNLRNLKYPNGFIAVKSTKDVKISVKCLVKLKLNFTVKCGGHSHEKYSYGGEDYWVIDLRYLVSIDLQTTTNIATVGAGMSLGMLSQKLLKFGNYGTTVGTCFSVGISGFTLGGGLGPFSRKYGLMVDRVVGMQVVTANAKVLNINCKKYSDLFWAFRGSGGGNFAIVTKFKIKVFNTVPKVASIFIYYELSNFKNAFANWQRWLQSNASNSIGSFLHYRYLGDNIRIDFVIHEIDSSLMLKYINDIRTYFPEMKDDQIVITSYNETLHRISAPSYYNQNRTLVYVKTRSFFVSKYLNEQEINKFNDALLDHNITSFLLEPSNGKINCVDSSKTAFCHRNSLYVIQYTVKANPTPEDPDTNETGKRLHINLENFRRSVKFMSNGECYINYIDSEEQDPFKKYYCNNFNRLVKVKQKYDPKNIFRFPLSIPLKIN